MFCDKCGAGISSDSRFCSQCGQTVTTTSQLFNPPAPPVPGSEETSGKAIGSLVTGIIGLILFPLSIVAIILGHMSRSEIRKSNYRLKGDGMATAGLVMGYGALTTIPLILIVAAIAIPNLLRARIAANESEAVQLVREINSAEVAYRSAYPDIGYACTLAEMGGKDSAAPPTPKQSGWLTDRVASGEVHGYRFELRNCVNSKDEGSESKYQVLAYPTVRQQTGVRAFCSDQTGVIRVDANGSADECLGSGPPL